MVPVSCDKSSFVTMLPLTVGRSSYVLLTVCTWGGTGGLQFGASVALNVYEPGTRHVRNDKPLNVPVPLTLALPTNTSSPVMSLCRTMEIVPAPPAKEYPTFTCAYA